MTLPLFQDNSAYFNSDRAPLTVIEKPMFIHPALHVALIFARGLLRMTVISLFSCHDTSCHSIPSIPLLDINF